MRRERGGFDLSQTIGAAPDPAREAAGRELREQFADRTPRARLRLRWGARTDERGRVVFDPAPPGTLRIDLVEVVPGERDDTLRPVAQLGEIGAEQAVVTLRLPAAR